jgi:hypothetical protein
MSDAVHATHPTERSGFYVRSPYSAFACLRSLSPYVLHSLTLSPIDSTNSPIFHYLTHLTGRRIRSHLCQGHGRHQHAHWHYQDAMERQARGQSRVGHQDCPLGMQSPGGQYFRNVRAGSVRIAHCGAVFGLIWYRRRYHLYRRPHQGRYHAFRIHFRCGVEGYYEYWLEYAHARDFWRPDVLDRSAGRGPEHAR